MVQLVVLNNRMSNGHPWWKYDRRALFEVKSRAWGQQPLSARARNARFEELSPNALELNTSTDPETNVGRLFLFPIAYQWIPASEV
jgi:hypothetical protein